jgi:transcriptional regulator with XRE-family HTH domain
LNAHTHFKRKSYSYVVKRAHKKPLNLVGPNVRKFRFQKGLSQSALAARCQRLGWDIDRDTIAIIEGQRRWVGDFELYGLALALKIPLQQLLPTASESIRLLQS